MSQEEWDSWPTSWGGNLVSLGAVRWVTGLPATGPRGCLGLDGRCATQGLRAGGALVREQGGPSAQASLHGCRMPWQGDTNNMIDRFDVRAHLDYIPDYTPPLLTTM